MTVLLKLLLPLVKSIIKIKNVVLKNILKKSKSIFQNQELYKNVFFFFTPYNGQPNINSKIIWRLVHVLTNRTQ